MRGFIALVMMLSIILGISQSFAGDFRDAYWGMSVEQVKKREKAKPAEMKGDGLYFEGELFGREVGIQYDFAEVAGRVPAAIRESGGSFLFTEESGFLLEGGHYLYFFDQREINTIYEFKEEYNYFKDLLIKEYGKPIFDGSLWKEDIGEPSQEEWVMAMKEGQLELTAIWDTKRTFISVTMMVNAGAARQGEVVRDLPVLIDIGYKDRWPNLSKEFSRTLWAYRDCLFATAELYSASDGSAFEIAEAAQGKCSQQLSGYKHSVRESRLYRLYVSDADVNQELDEGVRKTKALFKEKVIQRVIELRLPKEKK